MCLLCLGTRVSLEGDTLFFLFFVFLQRLEWLRSQTCRRPVCRAKFGYDSLWKNSIRLLKVAQPSGLAGCCLRAGGRGRTSQTGFKKGKCWRGKLSCSRSTYFLNGWGQYWRCAHKQQQQKFPSTHCLISERKIMAPSDGCSWLDSKSLLYQPYVNTLCKSVSGEVKGQRRGPWSGDDEDSIWLEGFPSRGLMLHGLIPLGFTVISMTWKQLLAGKLSKYLWPAWRNLLAKSPRKDLGKACKLGDRTNIQLPVAAAETAEFCCSKQMVESLQSHLYALNPSSAVVLLDVHVDLCVPNKADWRKRET